MKALALPNPAEVCPKGEVVDYWILFSSKGVVDYAPDPNKPLGGFYAAPPNRFEDPNPWVLG